MTAAPALIELAGLTKRYRRVAAVQDVSLAIAPGEIFGLLGPDGAGKSTIIQVLAGVLLPDAGSARIAGLDVVRDPEAVKARIGYMPQGLGLNLYDDLTIDEHLRFFAELRGVPPAQFREHRATLLEITRLAPAKDRLARHLSGGMRQKLGLAAALIHLPDILLLDEPTTGVDPLSRQDFWQIIARLSRDRGITVLLATPYLDEAERCHRVALLHRGRVLATGTPQELKEAVPGVPAERARMEDVFVALMAQAKPVPAGPAADAVPPAGAAGPGVWAAPTQDRRADGPAIVVEGLTKRFGDLVAVDHISFSVEAGEIFGFVGPNGAGKTTAIKMLTGITRPTAGRGVVLGRDVLREPAAIKRRIGYVSQRFSLYPDLTVLENLRLYARIYGVNGPRARQREQTVVTATGLSEWLDVLARDLPLGIRQRLALACAVLHEPPVLFLDEPTSGVDPLARRRFWDLILHLARDLRVAVLMSTHYMDEAERCDRLALMHQGRLTAIGEPEGLRRDAVARRGSVLEFSTDRFREAAALLEAAAIDFTLAGSRLHVFSGHPAQDAGRIAARLAAGGVGAVGVREVPMSMDDVFATLIEHRGAAA